MFLRELEIQGFKTFAKKTTLVFLPPKNDGKCPTTAIVGPNGSGKSNISDAIRWVLGEQSMRLLRGKSSEDVIFSGSLGKARAGFAEVTLTFGDAKEATSLKTSELSITRRLFRSGESSYLVNHTEARLQDIRLLLAEANVGERSYSVISQGMIDHILVASPEERKNFFDDATGIRHLQLKRKESQSKLRRARENTLELERILAELEPHLKLLKKQLSRLLERDSVELQLKALEEQYFKQEWWLLEDQISASQKTSKGRTEKLNQIKLVIKKLEESIEQIEDIHINPENENNLKNLQTSLKEARSRYEKIRDARFELQKAAEIQIVRAETSWTPLSLPHIIDSLKELKKLYATLGELWQKDASAQSCLLIFEKIKKHTETLLSKLEKPAPEIKNIDHSKTNEALATNTEALEKAQLEIKNAEQAITNASQTQDTSRVTFFEQQRILREQERLAHSIESELYTHNLNTARLEERRSLLEREMHERLIDFQIRAVHSEKPTKIEDVSFLREEISRKRRLLEQIGGIDPDVKEEHEAVELRYNTLSDQLTDLTEATRDIERIIVRLDVDIHAQSQLVFTQIKAEFQKFFRTLFGGGSCDLIPLRQKDVEPLESNDAEENIIDNPPEEIIGIEIQATPPGKRLKSLNLLSGGERALTSIALISAIAAVNPGPFMVLDEVDAALDEANTVRFAELLRDLKKLTQCILITHNRATMEEADTLYGVTMGEDGVSQILSVKLEDVQSTATSRR